MVSDVRPRLFLKPRQRRVGRPISRRQTCRLQIVLIQRSDDVLVDIVNSPVGDVETGRLQYVLVKRLDGLSPRVIDSPVSGTAGKVRYVFDEIVLEIRQNLLHCKVWQCFGNESLCGVVNLLLEPRQHRLLRPVGGFVLKLGDLLAQVPETLSAQIA